MAKKKLFIGIGILAALLAAAAYCFYFAEPADFPENEQLLVDKINNLLPQANASVIQDILFVDEHHALVPFISDENDYSLSYWVWINRQWNVDSIDTNGHPMLWKVDHNDPSSYRIVWNIQPDDSIGFIEYYLIRDRGYFITGEMEQYDPKIQMVETVSLEDESYGIMKLPEGWTAFIHSLKEAESAKQPGLLDYFHSQQYMYFGWLAYDQDHEQAFLEGSLNSYGYSSGEVDLEYIRMMDKREIEIPWAQ